MKKTFGFLIILVGLSGSWAGEGNRLFENTKRMDLYRRLTQPQPFDSSFQTKPARSLSPGRAGLYSLVVPGWGQWVSGHKKKAVVFLGVEVISWTLYAVYQEQGMQKDTEFRRYADSFWSVFRYIGFLESLSGADIDPSGAINWTVLDSVESLYSVFTHHLPRTKTQQYYEMIGKYDQFVYGWDDTGTSYVTNAGDVKNVYSAKRLDYEDMRDLSNRLLSGARWATAVVLTNHFLSALDAAITLRRDQKPVQTQLRIEPKFLLDHYETCAVFRVNW